jgi:hypothetical protein
MNSPVANWKTKSWYEGALSAKPGVPGSGAGRGQAVRRFAAWGQRGVGCRSSWAASLIRRHPCATRGCCDRQCSYDSHGHDKQRAHRRASSDTSSHVTPSRASWHLPSSDREGASPARSRRRAQTDDPDRPEGPAPASAGRGPLAAALPRRGRRSTIDELALAASCLAALTGNGYLEAAQALRDMTEKATRRRKGRGVA